MPARPPARSWARSGVLEAHLAGGAEPAAGSAEAGLPELPGAALVDGRGSHAGPAGGHWAQDGGVVGHAHRDRPVIGGGRGHGAGWWWRGWGSLGREAWDKGVGI